MLIINNIILYVVKSYCLYTSVLYAMIMCDMHRWIIIVVSGKWIEKELLLKLYKVFYIKLTTYVQCKCEVGCTL